MKWTKFTDEIPNFQGEVYVFADGGFRNFCIMEYDGVETVSDDICWCFCDKNDESVVIPESEILNNGIWKWWIKLPNKGYYSQF